MGRAREQLDALDYLARRRHESVYEPEHAPATVRVDSCVYCFTPTRAWDGLDAVCVECTREVAEEDARGW